MQANTDAGTRSKALERQSMTCILSAIILGALLACSAQAEAVLAPKAPGYRGVWYYNQPSGDKYVYKYSGGLGTYPSNLIPMAVYAPAVNKTFFAYGGESPGEGVLPIMIGCYDHGTGLVQRPTIVMYKKTGGKLADAHHNPTLAVDERGYIWVFASSHGKSDAFIYRSAAPYSIDAFEQVLQKEFSYAQPHFFEGFGFMLLFTKYTAGRELYVSTSKDGVHWSADKKLAGFGGHYQVSSSHGSKRGTAFNWHPPVGGLNARTNLYYMESGDFGRTWTNASGERIRTPLTNVLNPALVRDYQREGLLVYIHDLNFDPQGRPAILYTLTRGYESGPKNGRRVWTVARWTGERWVFHAITTSDHNYDAGALCIENDGTWRVIGPTEPGPQKWGTGGEMAVWISRDEGATWTRERLLTANSKLNHSYARRPPNAHSDFYAFWADGDAFRSSESHLHFATKSGRVYVLPYTMTEDFEKPAQVSE